MRVLNPGGYTQNADTNTTSPYHVPRDSEYRSSEAENNRPAWTVEI